MHAPLANVTTEGIPSNQLNHHTPIVITCYERWWPSLAPSDRSSVPREMCPKEVEKRGRYKSHPRWIPHIASRWPSFFSYAYPTLPLITTTSICHQPKIRDRASPRKTADDRRIFILTRKRKKEMSDSIATDVAMPMQRNLPPKLVPLISPPLRPSPRISTSTPQNHVNPLYSYRK